MLKMPPEMVDFGRQKMEAIQLDAASRQDRLETTIANSHTGVSSSRSMYPRSQFIKPPNEPWCAIDNGPWPEKIGGQKKAPQGVSPKILDLGSLPITELLLLASYPTM